jgi:hypothetical protein
MYTYKYIYPRVLFSKQAEEEGAPPFQSISDFISYNTRLQHLYELKTTLARGGGLPTCAQ